MSLSTEPDKLQARWSRVAVKERIIADFRDFRFSWAGFFRWTGITLFALLLAGLVTLYISWTGTRCAVRFGAISPIAREGRCRIDGNLSQKLFSWQPRIEAEACMSAIPLGPGSWRTRRKPPK